MPQPLSRRALLMTVALSLIPIVADGQVLVPRPGARPIDTITPAPQGAVDPRATALAVSRDSSVRTLERKGGERGWTRLKTVLINNGEWCNAATAKADVPNGIQWCHFYSSSQESQKAAKTFWNGNLNDGRDVAFTRMVKLVGNDNAQSTKVELLSDLWNTMRVSLSGVLSTKTSDSPSGTAAGGTDAGDGDKRKQSKAQQFLNGGGPASLRLERPFFVLNFVGSNTVLLGQTNLSFGLPGSGKDSPADSMQFGQTGIRLQSQIDGGERKISGIGNLSLDRVYGGKSFYRAVTGDPTAATPFASASFSVGLLIEDSVQLTWNKIFYGPRALQQGGSFISVNVTR